MHVLKWRDYTQDDTLFEVFLPEHDGDGPSAVLRAVRRGHVVAERRVHLTWRPTFGPDGGDVAAMDAMLERMIAEVSGQPEPQTQGNYAAGPVEIEEPDAYLHAALHALHGQSQEAIASMQLTSADVQSLLGPVGAKLQWDDIWKATTPLMDHYRGTLMSPDRMPTAIISNIFA